MALSPGSRLGQFEIGELLGEGAMGEVYLARDTKLRRKVAIKVLPESFAQSPLRLSRLEREAKTLASLDHRNIAALYDFAHEGDTYYLVLQLVQGETLAELLKRQSLPTEEAIAIFVQVARALEAAHGRDVIHRDLKPANVMVDPDGKVMVIDFGLAKSAIEDESPNDSSLSATDHGLTKEGVVVGTPAYMSPEQARGRDVDKRTDIWAFGCCLFEALSGNPPFKGDTVADVVARILRDEPNWESLPKDMPDDLRDVLRRCLERDSRKRLQDAGDIAIKLEDALKSSSRRDPVPVASRVQPDSKPRPDSKLVLRISLLVALLMALITATIFIIGKSNRASLPTEEIGEAEPEPKEVRRFSIRLSDEYPLRRPDDALGDNVLALSSDGEVLVYVSMSDKTTRLIARRLDGLEARPILGSEGALFPFFSPDGQWVGYQRSPAFGVRSKPDLVKLPLEGGTPVPLAVSELALGGSWAPDGSILFGRRIGAGIWRAHEDGRPSEMVTKPDLQLGQLLHGEPQVLPGGAGMLYRVGSRPPNPNHTTLFIRSFTSDDSQLILEDVGRARYVPSGHIVYAKPGGLFALPYDINLRNATGPSAPVTEGRMTSDSIIPNLFTFSDSGTLIYVPMIGDAENDRTVVWVDRNGNEESISAPPGAYRTVRISPDGNKLLFSLVDFSDIWIHDLNSGAMRRLTFSQSFDYHPIWMARGERVAFLSYRNDQPSVYSKQADGSGSVDFLMTDPNIPLPKDFSTVANTLVYDTAYEHAPMYSIRLDRSSEPRMIFDGEDKQRNPRISPDGVWIAYEVLESDTFEVYVRPFLKTGNITRVSSAGGQDPAWNSNGRELFFWQGDTLMAVDVKFDPTFSAEVPHPLFEMPSKVFDSGFDVPYDVAPGGERFVVIKKSETAAWVSELIVVENWFEELKRLAPPYATKRD